MTVQELREILQDKPGDMRVCVNGYEGGIADVSGVTEEPIIVNVNDRWYYGQHENPGWWKDPERKADETCLLIAR